MNCAHDLGGMHGFGAGAIEPDPVLGHAANFLNMLTGSRPSAIRWPRPAPSTTTR